PDYSGTGTIMVNTMSNGSIESSSNLLIDFAQINFEYDAGFGEIAYQTQHIDTNGNGGYTWEMNDSFSTSAAKEAFERAFNNWTCETGINWEIASATTSVNSIANDDVNIITFDISNPLPTGVLGQCYSRYAGCAVSGEIQWYVEELDIVFNDNHNWNYSTNPPVAGEIDFETVAVHELGHGHQLAHVIDTNMVMHYSISSGESLRTLTPEDISGASDVQSRSTTASVCSQLEMTDSSCALLGSNDFYLSDGLKIFPNPATNEVYIKNNASVNIDNISLYNLEGRLVYSSKDTNYGSLRKMDVSHLSQGVYFVNISTDYGILSRKLIVK
ncbi:MAG: T9SS type A sorting domain-containing protein, partial [Flavobacteriaceae bacterium]|nr:T9SS type A sorting domain-containing protein [Flavobacteriaceae bacterium]